eukprot:6259085-Pyramimonas_sp.AAC.1
MHPSMHPSIHPQCARHQVDHDDPMGSPAGLLNSESRSPAGLNNELQGLNVRADAPSSARMVRHPVRCPRSRAPTGAPVAAGREGQDAESLRYPSADPSRDAPGPLIRERHAVVVAHGGRGTGWLRRDSSPTRAAGR